MYIPRQLFYMKYININIVKQCKLEITRALPENIKKVSKTKNNKIKINLTKILGTDPYYFKMILDAIDVILLLQHIDTASKCSSFLYILSHFENF